MKSETEVFDVKFRLYFLGSAKYLLELGIPVDNYNCLGVLNS